MGKKELRMKWPRADVRVLHLMSGGIGEVWSWRIRTIDCPRVTCSV